MTRSKKDGGKEKGAKPTSKTGKREKIFYSRKHSRVPLEMEVEYMNGETMKRGVTINISRGGLYIKSDKPLEEGKFTVVKFVLEKEKVPLELQARVVWRNEGVESGKMKKPTGMGLEFVEKDEEKNRVVKEFVRDLTDLLRIMAITNKKKDY